MNKQLVNIVEQQELYNILHEVKNQFIFEICNYSSLDNFIKVSNLDTKKNVDSLIITNLRNYEKLLVHNFTKNNFLMIDEFPIKLEKLLDKINIQLIKHKYKNQANVKVKRYNLNINKRVINFNQEELKLTEREIDIILFLKDNNKPQTINNLQNVVWGYSSELETHTVETHIYRLRKKVKDKFEDENFIISSTNGYEI
jgi:hypothetical protein